jgi:protein tyrosine phosphatase type IVA
VAGLGRAPLLVALALVNRGCEPFEAIDMIRKGRRGALNVIQANYIIEYKPSGGKEKKDCTIF